MSTSMTAERYQKLLALKRREDMKDALNAAYKAQYSKLVPSQKIENEVQNFIRCAGLTENNLNRLTRRMEKHVEKKDDDNMSTVTGVSAYSARSTMTGVSKYSETSKPAQDTQTADTAPTGAVTPGKRVPAPKDELPTDTVKSGLGVVGAKLAPITEDNADAEAIDKGALSGIAWADLDKYAALLHERDAYQRKEQLVRLQNELKKDLDQQVSDNRIKKQKELDDDKQYWESQIGEIEKWKENEKNRVLEQKAKAEKEKEDRDRQLAYSNSIKQAEAEKLMNEDRALLDKIAQDLDSERRLYDTRKKQHKEAMAKLWQANAGVAGDANAAKKEAKAKEQEEDTKQMYAYMKMLEDKEKKTASDIKKRLDAHAEFLDNIKCSGLQDEKDREMSETVKMQTEQKAATRKAMEVERKKREDLKAMRLENQTYLFGQMKEKQDLKKKDQEEKLLAAQYLASDAALFHEEESKKVADKRLRNVEHRLGLEKQISANSKPYPGLAIAQKSTVTDSELTMSKCEVAMNKRLVGEVKAAIQANV